MLTFEKAAEILANAKNYTEKIVAFVDVMGTKNKMLCSKGPRDVMMCQVIMKVFGEMAKGSKKPGNLEESKEQKESKDSEDYSLAVSIFTDCMYVIADKDKIEKVLEFLSSLAYKMFFNEKGNQECDCLKLRGGITYGDVFIPEGEKTPSIFFGPAIVNAYLYESKKAFYPRIIADKEIVKLIKERGKSESDFSLIPTEDIDGEIYHYLDFLDFHRDSAEQNINHIKECINFVSEELKKAEGEKENQKRKIDQLKWYKDYLINTVDCIERDEKS